MQNIIEKIYNPTDDEIMFHFNGSEYRVLPRSSKIILYNGKKLPYHYDYLVNHVRMHVNSPLRIIQEDIDSERPEPKTGKKQEAIVPEEQVNEVVAETEEEAAPSASAAPTQPDYVEPDVSMREAEAEAAKRNYDDLTDMKWKDLLAVAKSLNINATGKNRVTVESLIRKERAERQAGL